MRLPRGLSDLVVLTSDNPRTEAPLAIIDDVEAGVTTTPLRKLGVLGVRSQIASGEAKRGYFVEVDRRKAIGFAISAASAGDLVLIAGKGHEDYQILGKDKIHFDDREVARQELGLQAGV